MDYINLDVWKECKNLVIKTYQLTEEFPEKEKFGLVSQMRRCAVSIPSNIAEGCGRNHTKDLEFSEEHELNLVINRITLCKKLLNGFINYFKKIK